MLGVAVAAGPCKNPRVQVPDTQYADADGTRIAYQMFGDGPPVLIVSGLLSNVEITWEHELFRRTFERISKHVTAVLFDKRGVGLSDRFDEASMRSPGSASPSAPVCTPARSRYARTATSRASR